MREIRMSGSEGGGAGNSTSPPYPYQGKTDYTRHAGIGVCSVRWLRAGVAAIRRVP
jgi:hypothetical protein